MSWRNTLTLHLVFWIYLLLGGAIFFALEKSTRTSPSSVENHLCLDILESVNRTLSPVLDDDTGTVLEVLLETCRNLTSSKDQSSSDILWDFSSALFLSMTILTTIGYGNLVPTTNPGKIFCIVYGFLGIPLAGILLASTSDYFSNHLLLLYNRQRRQHHNERIAIAVATLVYLVPGVLLFLFVPAAIFTILEGWSFLDGLYFSFVTLTTIGFGDLVAAQHVDASWLWLYRVGSICWIIIGIAYWAMIIAFVTKAFKSKELRRRWQKTAAAIVHQADELRKVVEHSIHQNQDKFLPRKSKAVFDFALHLSGSIAQLDPQLDRHLNVPGIATAFKPQSGITALLGLPILMAGRPEGRLASNDRSKFQNSRTSSEDSGVDFEGDSEACDSYLKDRSGSCSSLPVTISESVSKKTAPPPLRRSGTRPELISDSQDTLTNKTLKELLMEAMVILQEAETRGHHINALIASKNDKP